MGKTKKLLSILLTITTLLCVVPVSVLVNASDADIVVNVTAVEKLYDGQSVTPAYTVEGEENLLDGDTLEVTLSQTEPIVNAGTTQITATVVVMNGGEPIENQAKYTVEINPASIVINKRQITLTSGSSSKGFDNTPLTNLNVSLSGDGFANGEGATYIVTGTQTEFGSSQNFFEYTLTANTNADNYEITKVLGDLTVNPRYTLGTATATNGTVEIKDPKSYYESGEDVTVTVTPKNADYNITEVFYMLNGISKVTVSNHTENDYTFKMPVANITVQATFEHKNAPAFTDYINSKALELEAYKQAGDSQAVLDVIKNKSDAMKAVAYDDTKTLDENKAIIDNALSEAKAAVDLQRNLDKFEAYKIDRNAVLNSSKESGDSTAATLIIDNAVNSINSLQYDSSKTYKDNKTNIDNIVNDALAKQKAQREKDATSDFNGNSFFEGLGNFFKVILFPISWLIDLLSRLLKGLF